MADGIQLVTSCTFGNNALIFNDYGKSAFTLTHRDGNGIRVASKPNSQQIIQSQFPDFNHLFHEVVTRQNHEPEKIALYKKAAIERSFGTLNLSFNDLFKVENVKTDIPQYAPIKNSVYCSVCGESIMEGKHLVIRDKVYCKPCSEKC